MTTDWDNVAYCVMAILHKIEPQNESYKKFMDPLLEHWITNFTYTPKGLAFASEWGSLRQSTNTAFLALVYSKYLRQTGGDPTKVGSLFHQNLIVLRRLLLPLLSDSAPCQSCAMHLITSSERGNGAMRRTSWRWGFCNRFDVGQHLHVALESSRTSDRKKESIHTTTPVKVPLPMSPMHV